MKYEYESTDERIDELTQLAGHFELLMDGMRDRVKAINQRIKALSDEFDITLPDTPAVR